MCLLFVWLLPRIVYRLEMMKTPSDDLITTIDSGYEEIILQNSIAMASSPNVTMIWEESKTDSYQRLLNLFRKPKVSDEFQKYNYPRAFLLWGISSYVMRARSSEDVNRIKLLFQPYITEDGSPNFQLNRIDQGPFGIVALHLYELTGDNKYLNFADILFKYIESCIDFDSQIIDYRKGLDIVLNDMLGLVIPFLLVYYKITNNVLAKSLAEKQIDYFIKYGVDHETMIPVHGIHKISKIKVGSANWGRGIGWFIISHSVCSLYNQKYLEGFNVLKSTLEKIRNTDNLWSQFPGTSNTFDASASLMIIYSILLSNNQYLNKSQFFDLIKKYLTKDGLVLNTSGDTFGLNEYSQTFGKSELSQGLLLLILSELKD